MNDEQEKEALEFLEELANWNVPYLTRKSKGQFKRQIRAQQILADIYFSNSEAEPQSAPANSI